MATQNATDIANTAIAAGSVSQAASQAAADAVQAAGESGQSTGLGVDKLEGTKAFLLTVVLDDSGSMRGFEQQVCMAISNMLDEIAEASEESDAEILVQIIGLNSGQIQAFDLIENTIRLDESNYIPDGGTPLFTVAQQTFGALIGKVAELANSGRYGQTFTAFMTDGEPTDGMAGFASDDSADLPSQVAQLVQGLTSTKQHIVAGINIGGGAGSFFDSVRVPRKWQLDPQKDEYAFNEAIREVSRASRSASQGAGAFESVANDGFGFGG